MDAIFWVAAASAIVWFGLGIYIAFLASAQRRIARQIKLLELANERDNRPA